MSAAAPDAALVARFRADVEAALGRALAAGEPIALAVSGGPDSMAMLALAIAAFPGGVIAATVDHRLRTAAADEAAMVAAWCAAAGVPHATLTPNDSIALANVQAGARLARYRLLGRWAVEGGAHALATAHHADDQAETFLMRAARGSGVSGLAAIRRRQKLDGEDHGHDRDHGHEIDLVRPLLGWRVAELRQLAIDLALPFVDDPSNADGRFDRTRFRALLRDNAWLAADMIARSAAYAAEADAAIRAMEQWLWQTRKVTPFNIDNPDNECWLDISDLPRELKRRMSRAAISEVRLFCRITRPDFSDATNIEALLDALEAGKSATQAGVMVIPSADFWRFCEAPARRSL